MNIGIDLDSTLITWFVNPIKRAAWDLGIKEYPKEHDYGYSNLEERHRRRIYELFEDPDFMGITNVIYDPYDRLALKRWKEEGHRLMILTSRSKEVKEATEFLVREYFPEIDELVVCGSTESKKRLMVDRELDVWIDDSPKGIDISIELGIFTCLIYNRLTKTYNKECCRKYLGDKNFLSVRSVYETSLLLEASLIMKNWRFV